LEIRTIELETESSKLVYTEGLQEILIDL